MTRLKTLAAVALAVTLLPTGAAIAQDPANDGQSKSGSSAQSPALGNLDVDFSGGTLREYFRHLQDQAGVNNIVIQDEEIGKIKMPRVKLSGVHFADALSLVPSLIDRANHPNLRISPVGMNRSIYVAYSHQKEELFSPPENSIQTPISVDYPGGSLTDFVRYLQEKSGANRILLSGPSERFEIKPVEFEAVTTKSILSAYSGAEQVLDSGERLRLNVALREGLLLVEVQSDTRMVDQQRNPVTTASWSLASMRGPGRLRADQMLTAIEAAIEVGGGEESTKIRFHDETSLLIVSAHGQTIQMIDRVLDELRRSADAAAERQKARESLQYDIRRETNRIERLNERIDNLTTIIVQQQDAGVDPLDPRLETARQSLSNLQVDLATAQDHVEMLRSRLEDGSPD